MASKNLSESDIDGLPDRVAATFSGLKILLTGATGFVGKVLVEKLLRCCPDIGCIYLMIRTKKGKTPEQRLEDMFSNPLFDTVRALKGGMAPLLEKVVLVSGDVSEPGLDLSPADRELLCQNVDFIIHGAATVRFDVKLKAAVLINVRGTKLTIDLAKECKKLQGFMHISTAYCHLRQKVLEDKEYPPLADPHKIIRLAELLEEDTLELITPKILNDLPNTYNYTKALAEALVFESAEEIQALVLRPSILIPIWKEPIPGWTDNINGPNGVLIAAGKGVLRTMYCIADNYGDFLPIDLFINGVMVMIWNFLQNGDKETRVANFTTSHELKITWKEMMELGREITTTKIPLNGVVWYPGGTIKSSRLHHQIDAIFVHWIPAYIVDALLFCLGYDPVLVRVQKRISNGFNLIEYYATNQWEFKSQVAINVENKLNARERRDYVSISFCDRGFDVREYFENSIRSARIYLLKEYDDTLPRAKMHMAVMYVVDLLTKAALWGLIIYWMYLWFKAYFSRGSEIPEISDL